MKVKTSVSLDPRILEALDEIDPASRSRAIETAVIDFIRRQRRLDREKSEIEKMNRIADAWNKEMADVLNYQVDPFDQG